MLAAKNFAALKTFGVCDNKHFDLTLSYLPLDELVVHGNILLSCPDLPVCGQHYAHVDAPQCAHHPQTLSAGGQDTGKEEWRDVFDVCFGGF